MYPTPLTPSELRAHPSLPSAISVPIPTATGHAEVARSRIGEPITLSYRLYGHGPIKILWISGHGASITCWRQQMLDFGLSEPDKYTTCFYSFRSYEQSTGTWALAPLQTVAADAWKLADHLGWKGERAVHVVGHSYGGYVCQNMAILAPKRIASLTLMSTTAFLRPKFTFAACMDILNDGVPRSEAARWDWYKRRLLGPEWPREPDEQGVFPTNGDRACAEEWLTPSDGRMKGIVMQALDTLKHDTRERLPQIGDQVGRERIMVLHGSSDQMLPLEHGMGIYKGLGGEEKGARLCVLDGPGHLPYIDGRKRLKEAMAGFINGWADSKE